jgi:hypothetical protein
VGKIVEHVNDPGWWFTTLFAAFLVNILAGLLQARRAKYLSQISSRAHNWRIRREQSFETRAHFIAGDSNLILLYLLEGLALLIIELLVIGIFVGSYWTYRLLGSEESLRIPSIIVMIFSGLLGIKVSYSVIYRFKCAKRAEHLYLVAKSQTAPKA